MWARVEAPQWWRSVASQLAPCPLSLFRRDHCLPGHFPASEVVGGNSVPSHVQQRAHGGRSSRRTPATPLRRQAVGQSRQRPDRFPRREPVTPALSLPSKAFALTGVKTTALTSLVCHLPAGNPGQVASPCFSFLIRKMVPPSEGHWEH